MRNPNRHLAVIVILLAALALIACGPQATAQPTSQHTSEPPSLPPPNDNPGPTATPRPSTDTNAPPPAPPPDPIQFTACQSDPDLSADSPYPAPGGPYQVGVTAFQLFDGARPETFTVDDTDYRKVTIFVWYPAEAAADATPCSYLSTFDPENSGLELAVGIFGGSTQSTTQRLSRVQLAAYPDMPAASDELRYPVVINSNILIGIPTFYSSYMQELASHGYIAIDVVHTYGYPIGLDFSVNGRPTNIASHERMAADDVVFVIDQLAALDADQPANPLAGHIALDQIGVSGHSSGGSAIVIAAESDARIKAVIAFDGEPESARVLQQPFLLWAPRTGSTYDGSQGPLYHLHVEGFTHNTFTDMVLWPTEATTAATASLGAIDPLRAIQILSAYNLAFLDQYLRSIDQPLLDGPSPEYPEVTLESGNTD